MSLTHLYIRHILDTNREVNETIAHRAFNYLVEHDHERLGRFLARENCPASILDRARTHRLNEIRALYYSHAQLTDEELDQAITTERSTAALAAIAGQVDDPRVLNALVRRATTKRGAARLGYELVINANTPADGVAKCAPISQKAAQNASQSFRERWIRHAASAGEAIYEHGIESLVGATAVARCETITEEQLTNLLNIVTEKFPARDNREGHDLTNLLIAVVSHPATTEKIQQAALATATKSWYTRDYRIKQAIERHKANATTPAANQAAESTDPDDLDKLAKDPNTSGAVLMSVAKNPNTRPSTLIDVLQHPNGTGRTVEAVLTRPDLTSEVIDIAATVTGNPNSALTRHYGINSSSKNLLNHVNVNPDGVYLCLLHLGLQHAPVTWDHIEEMLNRAEDPNSRLHPHLDDIQYRVADLDLVDIDKLASRLPVKVLGQQFTNNSSWFVNKLETAGVDETGLDLIESLWDTYEGTLEELLTLATS